MFALCSPLFFIRVFLMPLPVGVELFTCATSFTSKHARYNFWKIWDERKFVESARNIFIRFTYFSHRNRFTDFDLELDLLFFVIK